MNRALLCESVKLSVYWCTVHMPRCRLRLAGAVWPPLGRPLRLSLLRSSRPRILCPENDNWATGYLGLCWSASRWRQQGRGHGLDAVARDFFFAHSGIHAISEWCT